MVCLACNLSGTADYFVSKIFFETFFYAFMQLSIFILLLGGNENEG